MSNKKIKLEDGSAKTSIKKEKDVETAEKLESVKEAEKKKPPCKQETKNEPMEVNSSEETVKEEKIKVEVAAEKKEAVTTTEHKVVKRENTPSTASEDETETHKPPEKMEISEQQSEEEDNGLLTACGPVVAASTVAAKKKQQQQQQKETKDNERESSSDDAAKSIYSIHKNSNATANAKTVERLTVTLAKNSNKKTANERLVAEYEKRCKMLHTMETYIRSILMLMQKDEEHANNNEQSADTDGEERVQVTIPARVTLASSEVGIMSDSGSSDDEPTMSVPKSPSATPPPLAPLSRGDAGLTIATVTSTATLAETNKQLRQVDTLSIDDADEDEETESEKQSDLNKSSSSTGSSCLANGEEASSTQIKESANTEAEVTSSPASPAEILTTTTVDPTQL